MSLQMANGEQIVKEFEYTKAKAGSALSVKRSKITKNLIVTNKRIIHRTTVNQIGGESIHSSEMPISDAKYVNVSYGLKPHYAFLVLGLLFILFATASMSLFRTGTLAVSAVFALIGILFFVLFAFVKSCTLTCAIMTDKRITLAMGLSGKTQNFLSNVSSKHASQNIKLRVKVNRAVAKEMADELGAILANAINGHYDEMDTPAESFESTETVESAE